MSTDNESCGGVPSHDEGVPRLIKCPQLPRALQTTAPAVPVKLPPPPERWSRSCGRPATFAALTLPSPRRAGSHGASSSSVPCCIRHPSGRARWSAGRYLLSAIHHCVLEGAETPSLDPLKIISGGNCGNYMWAKMLHCSAV